MRQDCLHCKEFDCVESTDDRVWGVLKSIDMSVCRFCDAIWSTKPVDSKRFSMDGFLFSYVSLCSFTLLQVAFIFVLSIASEVYIIFAM